MGGATMPGRTPRGGGDSMRVVRMIVFNWIGGAILGLLAAGGLLWLDIAGIGSSIWRSSNMFAALALLFGGFALTFASLVAGTAVMLMAGEDEPRDPPGGHGLKMGIEAGELIPVRQTAGARRRS